MENEKQSDNYWLSFITGAFTTICIATAIGFLDAKGQLDPILDFLGIPK